MPGNDEAEDSETEPESEPEIDLANPVSKFRVCNYLLTQPLTWISETSSSTRLSTRSRATVRVRPGSRP